MLLLFQQERKVAMEVLKSSVLTACGLVLLFVGIVIWRKRAVSLIAGYKEGKVLDIEGLTKWIGKNMVIIGGAVVALSALSLFFIGYFKVFLFFTLLGMLIICITTSYGCQKFEEKEQDTD